MFQVHVYDDGDTEIRQIENESMADGDLTFDTIEDLASELKSYGHDEDRINEALLELGSSTDWIEV